MRTFVALVVALAPIASARADVDPAIRDAIAKVKPADYPSANVVTVVDDQSVVYQADGQYANTFHFARLVLTQAGKHEAATFSWPYAKDGEKIEVIAAQVVKKDGSVVAVAAKDIQDTEQGGEMNIYDPNGRELKITFAGVAVGDVTDVTVRLSRTTPTRVGFFDDIFTFQSTEPIIAASYKVDGPASLPLVAQVYHAERAPKIEQTKTKSGDRIHYSWRTVNSAQLVPEAAMNMTVELPTLVVTTDPSWQHFSQWWAQLTKPQLEASPEIKAKVKELTKNAKTDEEKIKALYNFVAQDIRYRGLGVGPRTGYTPRKAHDTFTSRWGVCRDVSILLTSMLRESGFDAYPVLTNVGDPVLPTIAYEGFNHAIVAMPKKGGGWTYLDPTAKNNSALIPGMEAEQNALVTTMKGEPLGQIPALAPDANLGRAVAKTAIAADGTMTSKVHVETKGIFDLVVRSVAATISDDQLKEAIESVLHRSLPDAELSKVEVSSALMLWVPMTIDLEIKVPHATTKTGDYRLLRTLVTSGALGVVEAAMPQVLGALPERKYGLDAHLTFEFDQDETITLPAGAKIVALPNDATAQSHATAMSSSCTKKDTLTISCKRSFQLKSRFIDPAQYKQLRGTLASLGQIAHQPIILGGS